MYVELQCKTHFSFLRGASDGAEYIQKAAELGLAAIAITDMNGVYALPRAFEAVKNYPQVKLICGCILVIRDHAPLTLLAQDRKAYGLMCRILTAAHQGKEKGTGNLSMPELLLFLEEEAAGGLVGILPFGDSAGPSDFGILKSAFKNRLFIALTMYLDGLDDQRKCQAKQIAEKFDLRVVATNDVHYHCPTRRKIQDALTCVREGVTLETAGFKLFANEERYVKSFVQMRDLFHDMPDALQATLDIASQCRFSLAELTYQYPSEWIPPGYTAQKFLVELVRKGAAERYPEGIPIEVEKQIQYEFKLTEKMGYADYFLTVYDIVHFSRKNNIYCQGRGSAANSVICYCLGITVIDPIKMQLLFERFISEERGEPPDIDVDFEHERREEIIQYIYRKYGRDRAAMISAVRTYRRRSAFLEMSKAVGVVVGTISADVLEAELEKAGADPRKDQINALVAELMGVPRHLSIHACGFTLSAQVLTETVPIEPARMASRTICQWDKHDLDTLKLIKIDVLSLGFLSVIHKVCDLIGKNFWDIPLHDDPAVYRMIQASDTIGTFQIESRAQITTLGVTQPENFYDLVVEVALVRPGPHVGEMKSPYISRKEAAKRGIPYRIDDPVIEKILGRTFGVPIFQEQVMKLAVEKAGFTPGEADQLRRAIAAWRSAQGIDELSERFYRGLLRGGMPEAQARELFGYLKGFSAYGFPESHAASFAILSYISAWLKYYHPAELLCGLINSQPMGFYPIDVLINDAKRHGVQVQPIDPNLSNWDASLEADPQGLRPYRVRMGFRNIEGIRKADFDELLLARQARKFRSVHDFLGRTHFSREVIETMAMADVFIGFGLDQRHSFWRSLAITALFDAHSAKQLNLFEWDSSVLAGSSAQSIFDPLSLYEGILEDYRGLSYSLRGHEMAGLRRESPQLPQSTSREVKQQPSGKFIRYAGIVQVLQRPPTASGVAFMTLEDEYGSVDLVFFKKIYERYQEVIRSTRFLLVTGKLERRGRSVALLVQSVQSFDSKIPHPSRKPVKPGAHPRSIPDLI